MSVFYANRGGNLFEQEMIQPIVEEYQQKWINSTAEVAFQALYRNLAANPAVLFEKEGLAFIVSQFRPTEGYCPGAKAIFDEKKDEFLKGWRDFLQNSENFPSWVELYRRFMSMPETGSATFEEKILRASRVSAQMIDSVPEECKQSLEDQLAPILVQFFEKAETPLSEKAETPQPATIGMFFCTPFAAWEQAEIYREYERHYSTRDDATVDT